MKICILHPDLGIGGAERLIVDAAVALKENGHDVEIFTSHYDPGRAFEETQLFNVHVHGDFLPRHCCGGLHIFFAILRSLWLAMCATLFHGPSPDIFLCDQVSTYMLALRLFAPRSSKILFYAHFPDQLLSSHESAVKRCYRLPFDSLERWTTAMSDLVVCNSKFTRGVVQRTLRIEGPDVLYPCVNIHGLDGIPLLPPRQKKSVLFFPSTDSKRKKVFTLPSWQWRAFETTWAMIQRLPT